MHQSIPFISKPKDSFSDDTCLLSDVNHMIQVLTSLEHEQKALQQWIQAADVAAGIECVGPLA